MSSLLILLLCLAAGMVLRWNSRLPENAPAAFNAYVINVAYGAGFGPPAPRGLKFRSAGERGGAWLMLGIAALFLRFLRGGHSSLAHRCSDLTEVGYTLCRPADD